MEEEIVVAKKGNLLVGSIMFIIFGVVLIVLGVIFGLKRTGDEMSMFIAFFAVLGLVMIAVGVYQAVTYKKTPTNLITYKDGLFKFADGTTGTPNEITHVVVKLTRHNGVVSPTGGIEITRSNGRTISYSNVANVQQVQTEMQLITDEYNAELYRQAQAEAQSAQHVDPFAEIVAPVAETSVVSAEPAETVNFAQTVEEHAEPLAPVGGVAPVESVAPVEPFNPADGNKS